MKYLHYSKSKQNHKSYFDMQPKLQIPKDDDGVYCKCKVQERSKT